VVRVSSAVSCWRSTECISYQAFLFHNHPPSSEPHLKFSAAVVEIQPAASHNIPGGIFPFAGRCLVSPTRGRNTDRATDDPFKPLHHPPTARQVSLAGQGPAKFHPRLESSSQSTLGRFSVEALERRGGSLGGKPIRNRDRSAYITRQLPRIHRSPRRGLYRWIVGQGSGHRD